MMLILLYIINNIYKEKCSEILSTFKSFGGILKIGHDTIFDVNGFQIIYGDGVLKIEHYTIDVTSKNVKLKLQYKKYVYYIAAIKCA